MTSQDQAAKVIRTWQRRHKNVMDSNPDWAAQNLAIDLNNAGLLTPDLPRAWSPDGTPPAGEWEYAEYLGDYKGMTNVYHYDGEPTHRHFVGEWEEA
ncbi:TPA: hypothetical protein JAK83_002456 [Corynebacterium striatum]|nr:hypothetical protein [Corynebacterium striatum]